MKINAFWNFRVYNLTLNNLQMNKQKEKCAAPT